MVQPADIKHVAKLAKLSFDDSKIDAFTEEFNAIIDFVARRRSRRPPPTWPWLVTSSPTPWLTS